MIEFGNKAFLQQARDYFISGKFQQSIESIEKSGAKCKNMELNKLLIQLQMKNRQNANLILKSLLDMLTQINIQLYERKRPHNINFISHEKLYLNIIALSRYIGNGAVQELIGSEALFFSKSMKTTTILPIIYQCLRRFLISNKLHTSLQILQKFQQIIGHARNLNPEQQKYKALIYALFIKTLLKMGLLEESQSLFMLNFGETDKERFEEARKKNKNKFNFQMVVNFLHSEIELYGGKYENSINILNQILTNTQGKYKIFAQNNLGIIFSLKNKGTSAERVLVTCCDNIYKLMTGAKKLDSYLQQIYFRSKQNIFLAQLNSSQNNNINTHYRVQLDQKAYNHMKHLQELSSYKHQYRRGQCCLNLYHSTLEKVQRKLPWQQIHDNYDNVYYHPNVPYYQFKGKNKNIHLANKKPVYRRFILNQWNTNADQEQVDKDFNRRKFQKQAALVKLKNLLSKSQQSFKKALLILQKEEEKMINLQNLDKNLVKQINQKLFYEVTKYRSSILCLLSYIALCQSKWGEVIHYADVFSKRKCYEISSEDYYSVLTYQMQAYCELNRMDYAYSIAHKIINENPSKKIILDCRDSSNITNCLFENGQNQQLNFLYNFAVLNSRANRIPQTHQNIQKLYAQMNFSKYPRSDLPLSIIELLTYYNLRTKNIPDALQMIKRRGVISSAMAAMNKPILNITK